MFIYPLDIYTCNVHNIVMIKSFADNASGLDDLRVPPGNHLEKLSGDKKGQYSIRINGQYRICFVEDSNNFYDVRIEDYH